MALGWEEGGGGRQGVAGVNIIIKLIRCADVCISYNLRSDYYTQNFGKDRANSN